MRIPTATLCMAMLLLAQSVLLLHSATRHSPTALEPAFLAAGVRHWQTGCFDLYRVNPPLPRMIAALPVVLLGCKTDWTNDIEGPGTRAEYPVGEDFLRANGTNSIWLFCYARWACIPISLIGSYVAYRWANDLYGRGAGLVTLALWSLEPNLLAHAELVTPDSACTSFGLISAYFFWRWLRMPGWGTSFMAGATLGIAEMSKMSWLILYAVWPLTWIAWRSLDRRNVCIDTVRPSTGQMVFILALACYVVNIGYGFDGTLTPLGDYQFVSTTFTGNPLTGTPGNRFETSLLGRLPVPLPKQYLLGVDSQRKDLEFFDDLSYLRGEWKLGGWWYYYAYGLLVKIPCGTLGILLLIAVARCLTPIAVPLRDELFLVTVPTVLLVAVSSQLAFNHHLRYVFPCIGFILVFAGQAATLFLRHASLQAGVCAALFIYSAASFATIYPHQIAYFNDFIGGPSNGYKHFLSSNVDWGQDLIALSEVIHSNGLPTPAMLLPVERMQACGLSQPTGAAPFTIVPISQFVASGGRMTPSTRRVFYTMVLTDTSEFHNQRTQHESLP